MIGHYFATALHNLARRPVNAAIKLMALALGLACLLTAHVIGDYFRQADSQWVKADRIYTVLQDGQRADGSWDTLTRGASPTVARYLDVDFPELETVARVFLAELLVQREGADLTLGGQYVDPQFLEIFDLEMVAGERSLERPRSVLIAESAAAALFGAEDPIGQSVTMQTLNAVIDGTIVGVYRDLPDNSHFVAAGRRGMQVLTSIDSWRDLYVLNYPNDPLWWEQDTFVATNWGTYVVLPADGSLTGAQLNRRLDDFAARRVPPDQGEYRFRARPVRGLAETQFNQSLGLPSGLSVVMAFYVLGMLTLAVGCINFANLAATETVTRAREIGVRKTIGASRRDVAAQMLAESMLLVGAALVLVAPFTGLIATTLSSRFGVSIPMPDISRIDYWLGVGAMAAVAAIVAGVYPALALANLRPSFAMRITGLSGSGGVVRALLIGVQFAAAGFLLAVMAVMLMQNSSLRRQVLQPNMDPVVVMPLLSDMAPNANAFARLEDIRQRLMASPAIRSVSYSQISPFSPNTNAALFEFGESFDPSARRFVSQARRVYFDYFETVGVELLAGRTFSRDENDDQAMVIDAATAEMMGYTPQEALGKVIRPMNVPGTDQTVAEADSPENRIIGVVEREPLELMSEGPQNYVYIGGAFYPNYVLIQVSRNNIDRALGDIRRVWSDLGDLRGFEPQFLDEVFDVSYRGFTMITVVIIVLSGIAAAIAAMGLFGMASFVVQRRLREIGVRKTLGASGARVLGLMLWDFSKPVIVANLIVWPLAFVAARFYLNLFVTRIELTPLPFVLALGASLLIAWIAVSSQAFRAARVKPAMVLKPE